MFKKFFILFFILLLDNFAFCGNKKIQFIEKLLHSTVAIVDNSKYTQNKKQNEVLAMYKKIIDFNWNARVAIGKYWSKMSEEQQRRYFKAYRELLSYNWIIKFTEYTSQNSMQLKINQESINVNNTDEIVETQIIPPNGQSIIIDILTREIENGEIKILNIIVEGINVALAYRAQFDEYMSENNEDIEKFIKYLEDKNVLNKKNNPTLQI